MKNLAFMVTVLSAITAGVYASTDISMSSPTSSKLSVLLVTPPLCGHAHRLLALGENLVQRGHNVTLCTTMNWERIDTKAISRGMNFLNAGNMSANETVFREIYQRLMELTLDYSANPRLSLQTARKVVGLIAYPVVEYLMNIDLTEWDIVIADYLFDHSVTCLAKQQNVPVVAVINRFSQPHLVPEWPFPLYTSPGSDNMTFMDRLSSTIVGYIENTLKRYLNPFQISLTDSICKTSFHTACPQCVEFPCLVILPIGFEYPRPGSALIEHVGPMFLSDQNENLKPVELSEWLSDKPARSVVYISMGSLVEQTHELARALVNGLMATRYNVVWSLKKSNQYILDGLEIDSYRFFISNWVSQFKLLQHPAIAMAIVHGGTGGITEALYNRVPIIVVPFGFDQIGNAARVQSAGAGIALQQSELTPAVVRDSVERILDGDYRKKAEQMRKIFDGAGGVNRASDLVELYADIGYQHLIPAYAKYKWSWVQYYNADVLAVLCLLLAGVLYCTARLCKCCCGYCSIRTPKNKKD